MIAQLLLVAALAQDCPGGNCPVVSEPKAQVQVVVKSQPVRSVATRSWRLFRKLKGRVSCCRG